MFENYGQIKRDQIKHEIRFALSNPPFHIDDNYLDHESDYLMDLIDDYTSQDQYFKPLKELSVPKKAIYNLYNNYLIYNLGSRWNVKFKPVGDPYDLYVNIKTNNFYGSGKKLNLNIYTYRLPPKANKVIWLSTFDIETKSYHNHDLTHEQIVKWTKIFGLESIDKMTTIECDPNQFAEKFFQLLNFARYIFDQTYLEDPQKPFEDPDPNHYAKDSHIAKVYDKDDYGHFQKNIEP